MTASVAGRSLRWRLLAATIAALALALLLAGLALTRLFREHADGQFRQALRERLDEVTARVDFDAEGRPVVAAQGLASPVLTCGPLRLDTRAGRVTCDGEPVTLTSHEYKVLAYLMHRPGTVVSRAELTEHLYAQDFDRDSNTVEVFVARLRRKLPAALIETVRGMGYRLAGS